MVRFPQGGRGSGRSRRRTDQRGRVQRHRPRLLPVDEHGQPLRPAILYGVDTRATAQIAAQQARYGAEQVIARCGSPLTTQAIGPKLAWVRENEPLIYARTSRWYMASSYLVGRLTGEYVLDHHSASQCVPLYDSAAHEWIIDWRDRSRPACAGRALPGPVTWSAPSPATRPGKPACPLGFR